MILSSTVALCTCYEKEKVHNVALQGSLLTCAVGLAMVPNSGLH